MATALLLNMQVFNPADGTSQQFDLAASATLEVKRLKRTRQRPTRK
jgi:hypothetical protein